MNENLNLVEILRNCPEGTKLYSPLFGDVYLQHISARNTESSISVRDTKGQTRYFCANGTYFSGYESEVLLFPSRENYDWADLDFKAPVKRMKVTDFKPFDKILCRNSNTGKWHCCFFSHQMVVEEWASNVATTNGLYDMAIPYNDETAHLVGTTEDCPEYYKWWEE